MKVTIVHIDAERGDRDHLAIDDYKSTLCGREWNRRTRREQLRDTGDRIPCHRCAQTAREKVVRSLEAALVLARAADLDWRSMKMIARVP